MAVLQPENHHASATPVAWRSDVARHAVGISLMLGALSIVIASPAQAAAEKTAFTAQPMPAITLATPSVPARDWLGLDLPGLAAVPATPRGIPILLASHTSGKPKPGGDDDGKNPSGLPWKSGMQCYSEAFEDLRGRKVDVSSVYLGRTNWSGILKNLNGSATARAAARPGEVVIALAMLMQNQSFKDCNSGKLDGTFKDIGDSLDSGDTRNAIVRLGWEANGTSYAWSIRDEASAYKSCFSRLAKILQDKAPGIKIEWSMRKDNGASVGADKLYPGDGVVDIIGTSLYDRFPASNNESQWDENYRETKQGGPKGLGTWLDFAKSRGKKLAIAEWAVSDGYGSDSKDNPFYVEKLFGFLKSNSKAVAYEAYFHCNGPDPDRYLLLPEYRNPKSSRKYKELWRKGA